MMIPEEKAAWIAALRSGKYIQGSSALAKDGLHCCLGVLCEIVGFEKREPGLQGGILARGFSFAYKGEVDDLYLTHGMRERLGVSYDSMAELAKGNDEGKTFAEIADIIEQDVAL